MKTLFVNFWLWFVFKEKIVQEGFFIFYFLVFTWKTAFLSSTHIQKAEYRSALHILQQ